MNIALRVAILGSLAIFAACGGEAPPPPAATSAPAAPVDAAPVAPIGNPLMQESNLPFGAIAFDQLQTSHYREAIDKGLEEHNVEIAAIAEQAEPASFDNTIAALEQSGALLNRATRVFFNLAGTDSTPEIRAIQTEVAPILARHESSIAMNARLFERVSEVHRSAAESGLDDEQRRVTERHYTDFVRAGAALDGAARERVAAIDERMASLVTNFSQNQLADTAAWILLLDEADLAGLSATDRAAAAEAARVAGHEGRYAITLQRSSVEPFLTYSERRDLREQAWKAWTMRGDNDNEFDNKALIAEMVALRAERAQILGYDNHAHFVISENMAGTPEAALELIERVWNPALGAAALEEKAIGELARAEGADHEIAGWDWRHYAEKLRKAQYDISQDEIRPYLALDKILEAQFYVAGRLFGLQFKERTDLPVYHPDVRVFEVSRADGTPVGLFYGDYFARPSKRSGAWMSSFRGQHNMGEGSLPLIINVLNVSKAPTGQPTLLTFDDATTVFHEMGHALHGLLSQVTYPSIAGTSVARDFVEFPAQFYEHYLEQPEILEQFARHYETNEPMPAELMQRMLEAQKFNQGFATVEFLGSALVDMNYHMLDADAASRIDVAAFERESLKSIGMPEAIAMRHRSTHFGHIFAGGYSAGYYSYLWSEVLDADGFDAFKSTGDIFHAETAERLLTHVFAAGNRRAPMEAYVAFRGSEPKVEPLLRGRGFLPAE